MIKKNRTIIIAEAGVNHNGNLDLAFKLVDIAAKSKADYIKFQTYSTDDLVQKKVGLAKGGSLDNEIVVKGTDILNKDGLRNSKEFVNHKILDCIGDLFTSGYRIIGSIKCSQGGHYLTNQLLRKVFSDNSNFSIIEIQEKNLPHTLINRSLLRSIA